MAGRLGRHFSKADTINRTHARCITSYAEKGAYNNGLPVGGGLRRRAGALRLGHGAAARGLRQPRHRRGGAAGLLGGAAQLRHGLPASPRGAARPQRRGVAGALPRHHSRQPLQHSHSPANSGPGLFRRPFPALLPLLRLDGGAPHRGFLRRHGPLHASFRARRHPARGAGLTLAGGAHRPVGLRRRRAPPGVPHGARPATRRHGGVHRRRAHRQLRHLGAHGVACGKHAADAALRDIRHRRGGGDLRRRHCEPRGVAPDAHRPCARPPLHLRGGLRRGREAGRQRAHHGERQHGAGLLREL